MNFTTKLTALTILFLTLGITSVAAVSVSNPTITPEFTQDGGSPSYTLEADYSGFTNNNLAQDYIVIHMPSDIESSVDAKDITVNSPSADFQLTNYDSDEVQEIYVVPEKGNDFSSDFTLEIDIDATSPDTQAGYDFNINPYDNGNAGPGTSVTTYVDDTAPNAPSLNSVEAKPDGEIEIDWNSVSESDDNYQSGVSHYNIYRADSSDGSFSIINEDNPIKSTSFTDSSALSDGEDYFYKASAVDEVGNEGDKSGDSSATSDSTPPSIDNVAAESGDNTVTVDFNENVYSDTPESTSFDSNDFTYNNNNDGGATQVTDAAIDSENGNKVILTLDADVASGDLGSDSIQAADGEIYDKAENTASTTAVNLEDTVSPTITDIHLESSDISSSTTLTEEDQDQSQSVTVTFDEPMDTETVLGTLEAGDTSVDLSLSTSNQDDSDFTGTFTITQDIEADDSAQFSLSGQDKAVNSISGDYTYETFTVDTNAPEVTIDSPTSGPLSGSVDLKKTLNTADDEDSFTWKYSTNSGDKWTEIGTDISEWDTTTDFAETENTDVDLKVTAEDDIGNTGTDKVTELEVDNEAPTVDSGLTIELQNSENEVANPEEDIYVEWDGSTSEADKDVETVTADISEFEQEGKLTLDEGEGDQDNIWSATYDVTEGSVDSNSVNAEVTATDNAENSDTGTTSDISVDNNPPTVEITDNLEQQVFSGSVDVTQYFDPSSSDGESTTYEYREDGGSSWSNIGESSADSWDSTNAANGDVEFRATTTDDDGNSVSATGTATVDNKKPSINSMTIKEVNPDSNEDALNSSDSFRVSVNASDQHSTVTSVTADLGALSGFGSTESLNEDQSSDSDWTAEFNVPSGHEITDFKPTVTVTDEGTKEATDSPSSGIDIDSDEPQNPTSTAITDSPVDQGNDETVSVDVGFDSNPEAGTVYAKITDSEGDTLATDSSSADTGTSTTTVEVDLSGVDSAQTGQDITAVSKIVDDAGNANPNGYTAGSSPAVTFDNDVPAVESMSLSTNPVSDSETGDGNEPTLTVNFDEDMTEDKDQVSVDPDLKGDLTTTPTVENEEWIDSDTFKTDLQFTDDKEDTAFDVEVSGAQDVAGNSISAHSEEFDIDTQNPQSPSSVQFDSDYINIENEASVGYTVDLPSGVESGELHVIADDGSTEVEKHPGIASGDSQVSGSMDLSGLSDGDIELRAYIEDDYGNTGSTMTNSAAAHKDTVRPSDPSSISASNIYEDNVGDYTVDVTLQNGYEAGTLKVRLSDDSSNDVTKEVDISADDNDDHTIVVTGIDTEGVLAEEDITIDAKYTDEAGNENNAGYTASQTVHKDTNDPSVTNSEVTSQNTIRVFFNEALDGTTVGKSDFTVDGFTVDDATEDIEGEVKLTLASDMSTGDTPEVTVEHENDLEDSYGNAIDSDITTTPTDTLAPTLSEATTVDSDGDGYVEAVDFKFGEPVTATEGATFKVAGYSGETVSDDQAADQTVRVKVDEASGYDTGATPEVTVNAGAVEDDAENNNAFASDTTITSDEGAAPVLLHSEINNADSTSSEKKVDLTFTEFVDVSSSATAQLTNEPGELRFSSQTGETVQATYYEDGSKAVLETGDAPEVSSFTGVEDADHYREAGADLSDYSQPSSPDHIVSSIGDLKDRWDNDDTKEASSGDVILLESGTYTLSEPLDSISVSDLTIAGAGSDQTTLQVQDKRINRPASGFTLKGMEVSSTGGEAIYSDNSVTVESVKFITSSSNPTDAIGPKVKNNKLVVRNSVFDGLKHGAFLNSANDSVIESSTFSGGYSTNEGDKYGTGIKVTGSSGDVSGISIKENLIKNQGAWNGNVIDGYTAGIEIEAQGSSVSSIDVERNSFENNYEDIVAWDPKPFGGDGSWGNSDIDAKDNWFGTSGIQVRNTDASYTNLNTASNSLNADVDTFRRTLSSGANKVSFPINQGTVGVDTVTGDMSSVDTVWKYQNGEWQELATGDSSGDYFRGGLGYIFNMDSQETLSVNVDHEFQTEMSGDQPSSPVSYNATAGWNLLGSLEEYDESTGDAMSSLENAAGDDKYEVQNSPSEIETGHGYWTLMKEDGVYANAE